jgi:probable HAF family extracellular repeat protein
MPTGTRHEVVESPHRAVSRSGFLYSDGALYALGTLGGPDSYAYRINDAGQIVGKSSIGPDAAPNHAFLYDGGQMMDLGTLGGPESVASNLNSCGQIVGSADTVPGVASPHAFLYCDGTMTDLNEQLRPGSPAWTLTAAYGINDGGQIVGTGINAEGEEHAFLLTPVRAPCPGARLTTCSLGTPGFFHFSTTGLTPALVEVTAAGVSALAGSLGTPTMNDQGTVTFHAALRSGGEGVFTRYTAGTLGIIAITSDLVHDFPIGGSINNAGRVSFGAGLRDGRQAIFTRRGQELTRIADTGPDSPFSSFLGPAATLNSDGTVAFRATLKSGGSGIFTARAGEAPRIL